MAQLPALLFPMHYQARRVRILAVAPLGDVLFIHDLAVSNRAAGMGVGKQMVKHLRDNAETGGFRSALLVAVQNSVPFWQKFGFAQVSVPTANARYGADAQVMSLEFSKQ